ncbi:hypothetical protein LX99_04224 [Mucilaginibacter oryzae]|uniref:Cyclic nucleotide-binding domain-containing protein n=1 Tax=Mucilaginibacter oryzae TaxID=468058 RepID=A0A316H410_9SPHI|nr:hypothetical protein [Mucilaginibacter oryzae]PWK72894.1 hypothetical protein LX99_04224 [Mucilaginibacter oryzae]
MALTPADVSWIKTRITSIISANSTAAPASIRRILPLKDLQGKLYEAWVLGEMIQQLSVNEKYSIHLINSGTYRLKQKGTEIKRNYPYFKVFDSKNTLIGEIFTDTEFSSLSHVRLRGAPWLGPSFHELDIVLFSPGKSGRPSFRNVLIAVECKATTIHKSTFREVLGFRRELGLLSHLNPTGFTSWPASTIASDPPSVHLFYSTDRGILKYTANAAHFGIIVNHLPM